MCCQSWGDCWMAKCRNVRLGDVVKIQQTTCAFGGDSVWLLNLDMVEQNTGKIIDYYYTNQCGNSTIAFDENHVLYSKLRPNLNKVVCPNRKGFATSELLPLLPDNTVLTKEYLAEYLRSPFFVNWAVSKTAGAKMPRLAPKDLLNKSIPLPPLETQNQIAANLDKVTHTIDLCNAILEKLDLLVKSRFIELFGDVKTGVYKFETRKLGEVAVVGSSHRVFTTEFVENGVPFYRGTEIGELANGIKPENPYRITKEHYDRLASDETKPQIGDLLMPSICNKGQVWMVDTNEPFYYKDGRVLCISPNRELFNCKYLEQFMREKTLVEYPKLGSGSTFAEFKIFLLKDIDVLIPPIELQDQFAAFVEQTDKSKSAVKQVLEKAETLKKALMQEYFG